MNNRTVINQKTARRIHYPDRPSHRPLKMTKSRGRRQKREEYRAQLDQQHEEGATELPRKKFYRQRAHANPFSDHNLK